MTANIAASDVTTALIDALGREAVLTGEAIRVEYGTDESLGGLPVIPHAVVKPASTAQVATTARIAVAHRTPLTARGAGTGLSGACRPAPGGIVVSFERMDAVLEVDASTHVAVVQPGATLARLDEATTPHGLMYAVQPGTSAATLGGNVATNAGGMRAVKYGVTRHNVLGVEAVTGTGEVVRSGGRYVKCTTGYDLTQLIIGSEGTLALVTEAIVRLHPRPAATASLLALFASVDEVAVVVPRVVAAGVQPTVLEFIDRATMTGLLRHRDIALGVSADLAARAEAYLVVVLEGRSSERVEADAAEVAELLVRAGAIDVFVVPEGRAAELLAAREDAFWMVKAAGADDLIDMVVPRDRIPAYLSEVRSISRLHGSRVYGCGHAGDGNIHFAVYEPDPDRRHRLLGDIFAAGLALGGAISGEHGLGRSKARYFADLTDPGHVALQRRIKAAFDPHGILNPGCIFGVTEDQ